MTQRFASSIIIASASEVLLQPQQQPLNQIKSNQLYFRQHGP